MKEPKIYIDESKVSNNGIESYCKTFKRNLPSSYKEFLLKYNGGAIYQPLNVYLNCFPIQRFFSLGDLILQEQIDVGYNDWEFMTQDEYLNLGYDFKELLPIAQCEQGTIMISLNSKEYGKVYFSHYTGGEGVYESKFNSFNEFINNYRIPHDEVPKSEEEYYYVGRKLFEEQFFWTRDNLKLGYERFKEVYSFYSNPNLKEPEPLNTTIIQQYLHHDLIFEFLLQQGAKTDGLFNRTKDFQMIQYLYNELRLDINKPNEWCHPIITWSGGHHSSWDVKFNKELMDKLLSSKLPIDYSVKDKEGRSAMERYEILNSQYEKYWGKK